MNTDVTFDGKQNVWIGGRNSQEVRAFKIDDTNLPTFETADIVYWKALLSAGGLAFSVFILIGAWVMVLMRAGRGTGLGLLLGLLIFGGFWLLNYRDLEIRSVRLIFSLNPGVPAAIGGVIGGILGRAGTHQLPSDKAEKRELRGALIGLAIGVVVGLCTLLPLILID